MFYHAQLLGRSKLGFSVNASLASLLCSAPRPDKGASSRNRQDTRRLRFSFSVQQCQRARKAFRTPTPENRRQVSAAWYKPLKLSLVSGDNKERPPTSGARSSVMRFICARQPDCQADCRKKFAKDSTKFRSARKPAKTAVLRSSPDIPFELNQRLSNTCTLLRNYLVS